jgi:arylsulfatase A-like enzyme
MVMKLWPLLILFLLTSWGCGEDKHPEQAAIKRTDSLFNSYQPNIILIVSDDLGYGSLGAYGGTQYETPQLDYWAENGMQFTNFYVSNPVCSPSRASILSGRTPSDAGVQKVLRPAAGSAVKGMDTSFPTFAGLIRAQGYTTALIGKWHLGYRKEEHPLNRGFDYFKGFLGGAINYLTHEYTIGGHAFSEGFGLWKPQAGEHATKIFTDEAISFIEQKREQPYLLMLSYANPHRPFILPGENNIQTNKPNKRLNTPKRYKQMVSLLDRQLGRIHASITKRQQNTIIIFISDHGSNSTLGGNKPLKGGKGDLFEGGIKVPAIVYWPGRINSQKISDVTTVYDLYPTLLQLAGVAMSDTLTTDGTAFLDSNGVYQAPPLLSHYWQYNTVKVVRNEKWKALFIPAKYQPVLDKYLNENEQSQLYPLSELYNGYIPLLYNLIDDPNEEYNLSWSKQEEVSKLWKLCLLH